ncbi:MAG: ABC transporter permease [Lachnospiraceae bacterium]|nr:ABC transporter permease [Lachnospiraceae bacterium]
MRKAQRKDFFVEIKKSLNRYLSILFIVALGVAFFSGIRAAEPDMRLSLDTMADEADFMDIRVLSTMGLTEGDLERIRAIDGITAVEGEYSADVLCMYEEKELVFHMTSLTKEVNRLTVKEGRLPEKTGECFIDEQILLRADYSIGDVITVASGTKDPLSDTLKQDSYTVVGIGTSPYYLNFRKGTSRIGNGEIQGFVVISEEDFALEVYTQAYVVAEGLKDFITASEAYKKETKKLVEAVEAISEEQCALRLADIRAEAEGELSEAEQELSEKEAEVEEELRDAWQKLTEAEAELSDGRREIEENERKLSDAGEELSDGEKRLEEGRRELAAGERELAAGREKLAASEQELSGAKALLAEKQEEFSEGEKKLVAAREAYEAGKAEVNQGREKLSEAQAALSVSGEELSARWEELSRGKAEAEAAGEMLDAQEASLEQLKASLQAAGMNPEEDPQYMEGMAALAAAREALSRNLAALAEGERNLQAGQAEYDQMKAILSEEEKRLSQAEEQLSGAEAELLAGEASLSEGREGLQRLEQGISDGEEALRSGREELSSAEARLVSARAEIRSGEEELERGRSELSDGEKALLEAREKLADGEQELASAKEEYEEARAEAEEQLSDARKEISDAREELELLEEPEWYVLDRDSVQSYVEFDSDADRIGAIGKVFPVVFFLVAALVSLTTMTRMVEEKRTEIGTMKALGYGTFSIASKYVFYALSATLAGSVLGFLVGEKALPWVIITAYKILYGNLNIIRIPYNWEYALGATGIALLCTVGATLFACYKETLATPAKLMRPAAPLKGKKILLERIRPVWRHLNFSQKSTLRNLFRYKKRLLMTVFGIGACMALLIVGFGLRDAIYAVSDTQYGELWQYDVTVGIEGESSRREREELKEALKNEENVEEFLTACTETMEGQAGSVTKEINVVVPEEVGRFSDFFCLRDRNTKESYTLDDTGAIISEKLAKMLGIGVGDSLVLKKEDTKSVSVTVSHIAENYVYHYVYLSPDLYRAVYGRDPKYNMEYLKLKETGEEREQELAERLLKYDAVSGIVLVFDMNQTILDMLGSLDTVIWVLIISAGLLAFVVLYNLNNINITERRRELATIRLLGFYDMELAMYVYRENILLTGIGIVAGVFLGNLLHRFVIETVEVDLIMFGRVVHPVSYLWGAGLTVLFAVLVNVTMFYKLRQIDMVESLKSVE